MRKPYLDGWRGIAIILVLISHFYHTPVLGIGTLGVELFFVLSGQLMADILFVKKVALAGFFERRFSRVWPVLAVFVFVLLALSRTGSLGQTVTIPAVVGALTFFYKYIDDFTHHGTWEFAHLWSLCVEEHCYLFLAVVAAVTRKSGGNVTSWISAAIIGSLLDGGIRATYLQQNITFAYDLTENHLHGILFSVLAYLHRDSLRSIVGVVLPFSAMAFGLLGCLMYYDHIPMVVTYSLGPIFLGLSICMLDDAPRWLLNALSFRPLVFIGQLSYSLYIWQQPFAVASDYSDLLHSSLYLGTAIFVALASYYAIEQPTRKWLNRRFATYGAAHSTQAM